MAHRRTPASLTRLAGIAVTAFLAVPGLDAQSAPARLEWPQSARQATDSQATFRSGVEAVTVTASVRDRRGHPVRNLARSDFRVFDSGAPREIRDFYAGESPISLAILVDVSGSMAVGGNIERAKDAVSAATAGLRTGHDEAALFVFDSTIHRLIDFTSSLDRLKRARLEGQPWGLTSLYDSIAEAARQLSDRSNLHRAVLVLTDGLDSVSRLAPNQVSGIASSIDVPVYVLVMATPVDRANTERRDAGKDLVEAATSQPVPAATLADLARWTGGDTRVTSTSFQTQSAIQDLFTEIRHRYLLTFDPSESAGWHAVQVKTVNRDLVVRARSWYRSGPP